MYLSTQDILFYEFSKKRMPFLTVSPLHNMQYSHEPDFFT